MVYYDLLGVIMTLLLYSFIPVRTVNLIKDRVSLSTYLESTIILEHLNESPFLLYLKNGPYTIHELFTNGNKI